MKIKQLSLFLENKPGHLLAIARTLAEADINIVTLSLADTEQFGIVRLVIRDWARAKAVL
ncbi:MAG: ACT domain-containing protein, partial [Kiritimatiellaeota bacterium]|nr:ACT domain-containing protein [Kiritimatiellota bacterium]